MYSKKILNPGKVIIVIFLHPLQIQTVFIYEQKKNNYGLTEALKILQSSLPQFRLRIRLRIESISGKKGWGYPIKKTVCQTDVRLRGYEKAKRVSARVGPGRTGPLIPILFRIGIQRKLASRFALAPNHYW